MEVKILTDICGSIEQFIGGMKKSQSVLKFKNKHKRKDPQFVYNEQTEEYKAVYMYKYQTKIEFIKLLIEAWLVISTIF